MEKKSDIVKKEAETKEAAVSQTPTGAPQAKPEENTGKVPAKHSPVIEEPDPDNTDEQQRARFRELEPYLRIGGSNLPRPISSTHDTVPPPTASTLSRPMSRAEIAGVLGCVPRTAVKRLGDALHVVKDTRQWCIVDLAKMKDDAERNNFHQYLKEHPTRPKRRTRAK